MLFMVFDLFCLVFLIYFKYYTTLFFSMKRSDSQMNIVLGIFVRKDIERSQFASLKIFEPFFKAKLVDLMTF